MQTVNYGFWENWTTPQKVQFDGPNRLILVNPDVTTVDVKVDVYSAWKEWMLSRERSNGAFPQAMRAVGGDPTVGGQFLGSTFFLMNGWRMRTWEGDHRLTVVGNLYTEEGEPPFVATVFPHNIMIEYQVSNLVSVITAEGGGTGDAPTAQEISDQVWADAPPLESDAPTAQEISTQVWADAPEIATDAPTVDEIWNELMDEHTTPGTFGDRIRKLLTHRTP